MKKGNKGKRTRKEESPRGKKMSSEKRTDKRGLKKRRKKSRRLQQMARAGAQMRKRQLLQEKLTKKLLILNPRQRQTMPWSWRLTSMTWWTRKEGGRETKVGRGKG